ncbi:Vacuolar fusion protein mon1 [Coemansia spiralis]|uniref:Vacuolar fusion protein MON1 n=2 Tax=Coemansia TaxID=4863 RepID=A0A9W8G437_9FUNG|nr:vacuolar fusion protein MON1 [Coemansia spiralis]KAJ1987580.1 Vacuolar fusion protein mon1 [Coemansia umbellata]KAJ2619385.1 Vacuolar fusion protein mon1 [Coemansia sp. RSA 1358]KAJ2670913.1 Vacuolar fusion protein mon1 [Coemansia spiralis]
MEQPEHQGIATTSNTSRAARKLSEHELEHLEDFHSPEWRQHSRHFLVLSSAGKPIYSRYGDEAQLSTLMSATQAIISTFADMSDPVRSISIGKHTVVFYTNGPLYLLAASDRGDPDDLLRGELQLLYSQIVSILTAAQLTKIFEQRSNFDLRQLLGGTQGIIDQFIDQLDTDFTFALGSLDTLWMRYRLRERIGKALLVARPKGLLYAMVVADMKLVTLLRPRKHSLHPADLHLLFSMATSNVFMTGEHWTPVCFPRFNDQGFLHVYIKYITSNVVLLLISADRDSFFAMNKYCEQICKDLASDDSLQRLDDAAAQRALRPYELGVGPGMLLQLYYKHKTLVQHFGTRFADSVDEAQQLRIINTYKRLRIYMTKGGQGPLRIVYYKSAANTVLAWQSSSFELFAAFAPKADVKSMIRTVNMVLEWIKSEEDHLFVINAPSY